MRAILADAFRLKVYVPREHIYFDLAVRGYKKQRDGLEGVQSLLRRKRASVLLLFHTSRLFRKTYRTLEFVDRVHRSWGIRCVFVKNGVDTDDEKRWQMLLHMQAMNDEFVVSMNVENIRAAHQGMLDRRLVFGTLSYGYTGEPIAGLATKRGKPRREIVIDPETAAVVRDVFEWYVNDGVKINEIVRRLNDMPDIPLPPRSTTGRWSRMAVTGMLRNTRYRGLWKYGVSESVYQPEQDYVRQKVRVDPLKEVVINVLRIVEDDLWFAAQDLLKIEKRHCGRKPKDDDETSRPKVLNRILYCPEHDYFLYVGGTNGKIMFCRRCRETSRERRPLYTYLDRKLALTCVCNCLAAYTRCDEDLVRRIIDACRRAVEAAQRPDPERMARNKRVADGLLSRINYAKRNVGPTTEEQGDTDRLIADLRAELDKVQADIARDEAASSREIRVPTESEVRQKLDESGAILLKAATSDCPEQLAKARRIIELLTGGRIDLYQQGERQPGNGGLQGRFQLRLVRVVAKEFAGEVDDGEHRPLVVIDFKAPEQSDERVERAYQLYVQGKSNSEIEIELGLWRSQVSQFLQRGFAAHGLEKPDGRKQKRMSKAPLYQRIAEDVARLLDMGLLIEEIAAELKCCMATVKKAVDHLRVARGLETPDGRTRRKTLERKSRRKDDHGDAA